MIVVLQKILKLFLLVLLCCCVHISIAQKAVKDTVITVENDDEVIMDNGVKIDSSSKQIYDQENFKDINYNSIHATKERTDLTDTIHHLKKQDVYWYHDFQKEKKKSKTEGQKKTTTKDKKPSSFNFNLVGWILVLIALLVIIFLFLKANGISLFTKNAKIIDASIEQQELEKNIFESDLETAVKKYIAEKNYRYATRLLFLHLLKTMAQKNVIEYNTHKTNFDYLFALSNSKIYPAFANVVKAYEYVWYGEFEVNETQFNSIKQEFEYLLNLLKY